MELTGNETKAELLELRAKIDQRLEQVEVEAFNNARNQIAEIAKNAGIPLAELVSDLAMGRRTSAKPRQATGKPVPARYRDPSNPENTWTGRGREPKWVKESGKTREELLIDPNAS